MAAGAGQRHGEILDIESERSQFLAQTIVQFSGNPAALLLLGGDELGGERANFGAVGFRQRLQPLALGEVRHKRHLSSHPGLIDGAQADFEGKPCAVLAAAFETAERDREARLDRRRKVRGEQKVDGFPSKSARRVAEHFFGGAIDQHDRSVRSAATMACSADSSSTCA